MDNSSLAHTKMLKKLISTILIGVSVCVFTSCGAPKLEDKTEKADYAKMQSKEFNAKYTCLKNVIYDRTVKSDFYTNNKAIQAYEEGSKDLKYTTIVTDCDKNSVIKSRMGTELGANKININKAEVVPESLGNKKMNPTLLVKQSDIEMINHH